MTAAENRTRDYRFTVVIPVYNEEENIFVLEKKYDYLYKNLFFPRAFFW
jgi:hypothetical protein